MTQHDIPVTLMVLCPGGFMLRVAALVHSLENGNNPLGDNNISIVILDHKVLGNIMDIQLTTYDTRLPR